MAGFPHLPGVTLNLADLGLKIAPPPAGPKVTLLGVTSNEAVPKNEPLTVTNIGKVTNALWVTGSGPYAAYPGELALAVEEASAAGAQNIEILVIEHVSGATHDSWVNPTDPNGQMARYTALSTSYDVLKQGSVSVVCPLNAWLDATGADFGKQLADFCHQSSKDVDNTAIGITTLMTPIQWADTYRNDLTTGNVSWLSELNSIGTGDQADYHFGLPSIDLVNEWVRYVTQDDGTLIPTSVASFPTHFNGYLAGSEDDGGVYYPLNNSNAATAVNSDYFTSWQATNTDGTAATDNKGNKVDGGRRIAVMAAPVVTNTTQIKDLAAGVGASLANTTHNVNGAAAYAGFITTLPPQSAPTNKQLVNLKPTRPLSPAQANKITARRLTTMHNRANGFVITSAITGAHNVSKFVRSDFVRLTTMRIVDAVVDIVRSVSDKYIGEPNTASARNALHNEIEKFLKQMRVAQALNGWKMFISATPDQQVLGEATIDLTLVPAFELVQIEANVSLASKV